MEPFHSGCGSDRIDEKAGVAQGNALIRIRVPELSLDQLKCPRAKRVALKRAKRELSWQLTELDRFKCYGIEKDLKPSVWDLLMPICHASVGSVFSGIVLGFGIPLCIDVASVISKGNVPISGTLMGVCGFTAAIAGGYFGWMNGYSRMLKEKFGIRYNHFLAASLGSRRNTPAYRVDKFIWGLLKETENLEERLPAVEQARSDIRNAAARLEILHLPPRIRSGFGSG